MCSCTLKTLLDCSPFDVAMPLFLFLLMAVGFLITAIGLILTIGEK